ncbi:MAG: D-Ala-D-Ala carboxypeptidase family metallohydrolase [Silvimonas sp.]|nr:D-Ala-D-Ala carboxypeptidase family metallohydrolase [Silvimonas sp.]
MTEHFSLEEMTASQTATRLGLNNQPGPDEITNLHRVCSELERVRGMLGVPLLVSSGYRSIKVNAAVGGSATSAHRFGLAADFTAPRFGNPLAICKAIAQSDLQFDQLIYEGGNGGWVHLGLASGNSKPRRQVLSWTKGIGYQSGLVLP